MITIFQDPAIVSVIVTGFVAIATVIGQPLISLIIESRKWNREQRSAERERIDKAAVTVLSQISPFLSGDVKSATNMTAAAALRQLHSSYYEWHWAVWAYHDPSLFTFPRKQQNDIQQQLNLLKGQIEIANADSIHSFGPDYAEKIIKISNITIRKI